MKVLLLSAYDADSHKRWRHGLVAAIPDWQWTVLHLPPRYFSWRVRGNSLSWGRGESLSVLQQPWDLIVATSMTDLAALRGLVPSLGRVPTAVYFHENQFGYPRSKDAVASVEPQLLNIYTALCGDLLLFNSEYNRQTLLDGAAGLLKKLPDQVPQGICEEIAAKSCVLPVPLEEAVYHVSPQKRSRLTFVWNHRWEYDKGPDILLAAVQRFADTPRPFTLHVVGQQFRREPPEFSQLRQLLEKLGALGAWGYQESLTDYRQLLSHSHAVISTARHDFQGLAVLEAVAAGCLPLVPDSLAYPEWFGPGGWRNGEDVASSASALAMRMEQCVDQIQCGTAPRIPDVSHMSWKTLGVEYRRLLEQCARSGRRLD